ncbi:MAG: hypothetical protein GIX03_04480 [Candidatus Eremiobacteraeota bacterium]|nr:hypothetical protein [Candidatus Eremiobacteraeota bacterium]MBC5802257.1 hypothetical protein [Candidatus Eremiobacteraeota bacterium]MBC5822770.1 hypothetical protein [Candidatus Eremiobacteraeota bacterium]
MSPEQPADPGSENLWCGRCLDRYYSAAATTYIGTPCLRDNCDGVLMHGIPAARPYAVPDVSEAEGGFVA